MPPQRRRDAGFPCAKCGGLGPFSSNQKTKGVSRRCTNCVGGGASSAFKCRTCDQAFRDQNALNEHSKTHRERNFPCPGCKKMYRGMADTASHFESGGCSACRGKSNARKAAYQLVAGQQGGSNFLANDTKLLTMSADGGVQAGGYSEKGPNYCCPACRRKFKDLSGLMQHTQSRPACRESGQQVNLRLGVSPPSVQRMKFYHGTTWDRANSIQSDGFLPSEVGCLGRGVYVARVEKARKFAEKGAREMSHSHGGLVELLVTVRNPKYVQYNDTGWQREGYDACRTEQTTASTNMEWCISNPSAIEVTSVTPVHF